jgi:hypothetical protein
MMNSFQPRGAVPNVAIAPGGVTGSAPAYTQAASAPFGTSRCKLRGAALHLRRTVTTGARRPRPGQREQMHARTPASARWGHFTYLCRGVVALSDPHCEFVADGPGLDRRHDHESVLYRLARSRHYGQCSERVP